MPAPSDKNTSTRIEWFVAALVSVAILWLHFYFWRNAGGLWRDEVNLVNLSGRASLHDMARDSFPVLMPLLVHGWSVIGLGRNDEGLRLLGALIGLGMVAALWVSAWLTRRSPPLLGLVLLALNSAVVAYGDSLRGYGLGSLLIVLVVGAAGAFLHRSSTMRGAWLALSAVLSVQALYQNAVLVGAICLGCWAVCLRRNAWRAALLILGAGVIAAVSLLPYVSTLIAGRSSVEVLRTDRHFKYILDNLADGTAFPMGKYSYVWLLLAITVIAGGCAVLRHKPGSPVQSGFDGMAEEARLFAGTTLVAAGVGFVGFLWWVGLPTQPWYVVPLLALAVACFDAGLPSLPRLGRVVFFGFVAATTLVAFPVAQRNLNHYRFTNVDLWSRQLAAEASPEDYVVVTPWYCGISFNRYFKSSTPWTTLPPLTDHLVHHYDLVRIEMQNTNAIQSVLDHIALTLRSGRRVWVVSEAGLMYIPDPGTESPYHLPPPPLPNWGWSGLPYTLEWASETAHFLGNHSRQFERVNGPATGGLPVTENLDLFVASGWKDSRQSVSPPNSETNKP